MATSTTCKDSESANPTNTEYYPTTRDAGFLSRSQTAHTILPNNEHKLEKTSKYSLMKKTLCYLLLTTLLSSVNTYASEGALRGRFAVSTTDTIAFARANLQYQPSTATWRFAENQWDFVGLDNQRIRSYQYSSDGWVWTYNGWLDLFGWGTGNKPTNSSTTNSDYNSYNEWGNNAISNGGNTRNLWRTLSQNEWDFLYHERTNAHELYANGCVNGVNGSILLPDNWILPARLHFKSANNTDSAMAPNNYTADEWVIMEMAGAVFLPVTYERSMDWQRQEYCIAVYATQTARYWTSTPNGSNGAYYNSVYGNPKTLLDNRYVGKAVRLVQTHDGSSLFPVMEGANNALLRWESMPNAETYTLHVYSDSAKTDEVLYVTFDREGVVTGLHFTQHAPARFTPDQTTDTPRMFFYTLTDLQADTYYWYTLTGEDADGQTLQTLHGDFHTLTAPHEDPETDTPTELTAPNTPASCLKILRNGQLIIIRHAQAYTLSGLPLAP